MLKWMCLLLALLGLSACGSGGEAVSAAPTSTPVSVSQPSPSPQVSTDQEETMLKITVNGHVFLADFEDNRSTAEFQALLAQGPITIPMQDYGGFEKVGSLGTTLTRSDQQITTQPGDVILYHGNQITIYYGTNTWSFTRLAKIQDPTDLSAKLGGGTVQVTFSLI